MVVSSIGGGGGGGWRRVVAVIGGDDFIKDLIWVCFSCYIYIFFPTLRKLKKRN